MAATARPQVELKSSFYDSDKSLLATPIFSERKITVFDQSSATGFALAHPKVSDWVARFPERDLVVRANFLSDQRQWEVKVWAGESAGQIALVRVRDGTGDVLEAWTGPQVNWVMARGNKDSPGRDINDPEIWFGFVALFLLGLIDYRRLRSIRNVDLCVLVSFSASFWFFNQGEIFTSVALSYPPLIYLFLRMLWLSRYRNSERTVKSIIWPTWFLVGLTVLALGFRVGLNLESPHVIDVGYASVIGAQRIVTEGRIPYGNFPKPGSEECGVSSLPGGGRDYIQFNGRCETSNEQGDTYGPVAYLAYIPGYLAFGWSGKWDSLPAAHVTALVVDLLVVMGLVLVGWRYGRARLAAILAFAWVAFPFTQYVLSMNSNDALISAFLILGFWLAASSSARGFFLSFAAWAKFAPLVLAPLWLCYPRAFSLSRFGQRALFLVGFLLGSSVAFWILLLEGDIGGAIHTFWDRTLGWQLGRSSPFSVWGWERYNYWDMSIFQRILQALVVIGALATAFIPKRRSPVTLAALTAALIIGVELAMNHWFYLYIVWFFPFVLFTFFINERCIGKESIHLSKYG